MAYACTQLRFHTEAECAYAAGLIDGEGTISLKRRNPTRHGGNRSSYEATVAMSSTTPVLIDWLQERWPGGIYLAKRGHKLPHQKDVWLWRLGRTDAIVGFLNEVLPYLVLKAPHARLILAFRETVQGFRGSWAPVTPEVSAERTRIFQQMCKLNERGRRIHV